MEQGTRFAKVVLAVVALLLCSTISVPLEAGWLEPLRVLLSSLPMVAATDAVGDAALTQVRFSLLSPLLVLAAAVLLLNLLLDRNSRRRLDLSAPLGCLLLFVGIALVSALYYKNAADFTKLVVYAEIALSICWMTEGERAYLRRALSGLLIGVGLVNALVTIAQFLILSQGSFGVRSLRLARPDGLFGDSIISALVSAMALIPLVRREGLPTTIRAALVGLLLVSGVATGARSFYFLAAMACALAVLFFVRGSGLKAILCCAVCIIGVAAVVTMVDQISSFEESVSSVAESAPSGREIKAALALHQFDQSPVIGIGTGQYAHAEVLNYGTSMTKLGINGTNPHNIYLQVLCENGLLGFIPFAGFLLCSLRGLWKRHSLEELSLLLLFCVIGMTLGIWYSASVSAYVVAVVFAGLSSLPGSMHERC
jgi:Lipid A core - O-antigen ligase and related enzymes